MGFPIMGRSRVLRGFPALHRLRLQETDRVIYQLYQAHEEWAARLRPFTRHAAGLLRGWEAGRAAGLPLHQAAAALQLLEDLGSTHARPEFGLASTRAGNRAVAVREEVVRSTPFGRLLRFAKDTPRPGPPLLVVAPLSGHFPTRLRG